MTPAVYTANKMAPTFMRQKVTESQGIANLTLLVLET